MITKNKIRVKMTIIPMVIFLMVIALLKFVIAPNVTENKAQASTLHAGGIDETFDIFAAVTDWRKSKIIRTSISYNPATFYEMSAEDIKKLFGQPSLHRADGPARMLQYTYGTCVADFYYLSGENTRITHYEVRQLSGNKHANCLDTLLQNL